jgi:hypothetical protein
MAEQFVKRGSLYAMSVNWLSFVHRQRNTCD